MAKSGKKAVIKKAGSSKASKAPSKKPTAKKQSAPKPAQKPAKTLKNKAVAAKKTTVAVKKPLPKKSSTTGKPPAKKIVAQKQKQTKPTTLQSGNKKSLHRTSSQTKTSFEKNTSSAINAKKSVAVHSGNVNGHQKTSAGKPGGLNPQKNIPRSGTLPKTTTPSSNHKMPNVEKVSKANSKSAPPMRLSVNDSDMIASAKARFGSKDLENFKRIIIEQRTESSEEFDIISEQMLDTSGEFDADNQAAIHSAEQGTDAMEREKTFLHAQRTSDYIKKLDEALERIERGTYGICVVCGELIEKGRLEAVPITQKHVDCKNKTQAKKLTSDSFREVEEAAD